MTKSISKRFKSAIPIIIWVLIALAFIFEFFRDIHRDGDFMGYVNAGNAVLQGLPIYIDYLNTWPPFFSIFAVPLAWLHNFNPILVRSVWLLGIVLAWVGIFRISLKLFFNKNSDLHKISWGKRLTDWRMLLPFLLVFRFVIDDISNLQINSYLLLASLFIVHNAREGKHLMAGITLAFIISLKVYPLFLLFYFIWKRNWVVSGFSLLFLAAFNAIPFLVFGNEIAWSYYLQWIDSRLLGDLIVIHKNQSLHAFIAGLVSNTSRGFDYYYNVLDLTPDKAKLVTRIILLSLAIVPAWAMRKSWKKTSHSSLAWEVSIVLAATPLYSPLAWKYYFLFLFPLVIMVSQKIGNKPYHRFLVPAFVIANALNILTTDGIIGRTASDWMEIYGCITLGTVILILIAVHYYWKASDHLNKASTEVNYSSSGTARPGV